MDDVREVPSFWRRIWKLHVLTFLQTVMLYDSDLSLNEYGRLQRIRLNRVCGESETA